MIQGVDSECLGKWAPLKLIAIVALPHDAPLLRGEIIPQIASNKNCDKTRMRGPGLIATFLLRFHAVFELLAHAKHRG
jgi:hypothetical protein